MMRRHVVRPYGLAVSSTRMLSMVMALGLIWVAYGWMGNPANWTWLADSHEKKELEEAVEAGPDAPAGGAAVAPAVPEEKIVPGPNDLDEVASKELKEMLKLITDRTPLKPADMPMYWGLMAWSRTESFADQKKRAKKDVPFTQLWEESDRFRGELLHLRLHVRRVLHYKAEENPQKIKDVYEVWGWTDDSKSFPYVVVFPERPPGLPIGTDVRAEVDFTGYFLKVMSYTAFDVSRGAPLLVGRARLISNPMKSKSSDSAAPMTTGLAVIGVVVILGFGAWNLFRVRPQKVVNILPDELPPLDFQNDSVDQDDQSEPHDRPNLPVF